MRVVTFGWMSSLAVGLIGMIAVSGWAFIDHLDPGGEWARSDGTALPPLTEAQISTLSPETAHSGLPAPRDETGTTSTPSTAHLRTPGDRTARSVPEASPARVPAAETLPPTALAESRSDIHYDVRQGDSLYEIFLARELSSRELHDIVSANPRVADRLSKLRPGDVLRLHLEPPGSVLALSHFRKGTDSLTVERQAPGDYAARWTPAGLSTPAPRIESPVASEEKAGAIGNLERELVRQDWNRREIRVDEGDSLYGIFVSEELAVAELIDLLGSSDEAQALKRLLPGQTLEIYLDAQRSVRHLAYHLDGIETLHFFRRDDGFDSERYRAELERRLSNVKGEVRDSFYLSARGAGLPDRLIMEMAGILDWDIDFSLDIRSGDRFAVIYEELYQPDGTMSAGTILAAEFVNRGRTIRALRYEDGNGEVQYYSPEGFSMRKAFLRAPVDFTRISSRYGMRHHPILHKLRHHNGVDYAAPRGTPVRATGDGQVAFIGRKGGYGKTIILEHGDLYSTLYAHLHAYTDGLKQGDTVQQGQIIGKVGSTGLSTGPHLHYEFRVQERHQNPLTTKLPDAPPIAPELRSDFLEQTAGLLARLEHLSRTQLASSN